MIDTVLTHMNSYDFNGELQEKLDKIVSQNQNVCEQDVLVNVYDVTERYKWTKNIGLGIFHTGVVLYNKEFAYGKHDEPQTGVYVSPVGNSLPAAIFYRTLKLGTIHKNTQEVIQVVRHVADQFAGDDYSLIYQNCNHFSQELVNKLFGRGCFPLYINRISRLAVSINNFTRCFGLEFATTYGSKNSLQDQTESSYSPSARSARESKQTQGEVDSVL